MPTQQQQTQLKNQLKDMGYRAAVFQRGLSWRLRVSVSTAKELVTREDFERDKDGYIVRDEQGGWKRKQIVELQQKNQLRPEMVLIHLRNNGWPYARLMRYSSTEAVFEIDHRNNFWKILAE